MRKIKGIIYLIEVADSFLDWTHGCTYLIVEVYLPSLGIAFNEKGYIFRADEDRYSKTGKALEFCRLLNGCVKKIGEIELDYETAMIMVRFLEEKERLDKILKENIEIIKKKFRVEAIKKEVYRSRYGKFSEQED